MPRESLARRRERMGQVLARLERAYPHKGMVLRYGNKVQLLVAVMLSAQCTDAMVNKVTATLFRKYRTARDFAEADPRTFEREIHSTGFYRSKTKNVLAMAKALVERHGGRVPGTLEELVALPGVGRKTANVVLWEGFGRTDGIAVDTHVTRLSNLLGFVRTLEAEKIERELVRLVPREAWGDVTHLLIAHGRAVCVAGRPRCERCVVNELCPSALRPPAVAASASQP